jgi:hypothetical protein
MRSIRLFTALVVLGMTIALVVPASAQDEVPACSGDSVSGVVVAVDPASGLVTIAADGGGLCTVVLTGTYDHPIVALLGQYFGDVKIATLAAALEAALDTTETWVVCEAGVCNLADETSEAAAAAIIVGITDNGDGTFTLELMAEGSESPIEVVIDDLEQAQAVMAALESLHVDWELQIGEDGAVGIFDVGDEIAALHQDGMGFGVIVKLYAIAGEAQEACEAGSAAACDLTLESLISAFQSGTGLGELFRLYGRPSLLGVGHVRQAADGTGVPASPGSQGSTGICNARSHGGQAGARGQGEILCPDPQGPDPVEPN